MAECFLYDAVRTPFGRYGGSLAAVRADDLAAHVVRELLTRAPGLDPAQIDDVLFGDANQAGEDNRDVARMAVLLAGLPTSVPGTTINRLCGSSLDAAMQGSRAVEADDALLVLIGGVESMSRAPAVLLKPEKPYAMGEQTLHSTTLGWRMVNPAMPDQWTMSLGASTERLAAIHEVTRDAQDAFAVRSHQRAAAAWDAGFYDDWVIAVPGTELERDETLRPDTSIEKLAALKPAFAKDGTVTAGNASSLNDGAGAFWLDDERARALLGREPLGRAGIGWDDLELVELNEAFAAQSLACLGEWGELDPERVNVNGGAIAIGHPLGASGVRILGTLAHELRRRGGGYGLAAICIGVGQGLAVVIHA